LENPHGANFLQLVVIAEEPLGRAHVHMNILIHKLDPTKPQSTDETGNLLHSDELCYWRFPRFGAGLEQGWIKTTMTIQSRCVNIG